MTVIVSKGQVDQLMERLRFLAASWASLEIIDLSAYCDCGESAINGGWPDIEYFLRCHIERGHRVKVDFLMRVRAEVIPESQKWTQQRRVKR